ncbi:hypothetical protein G5714_004548 [Onychostoma macrolepis]|uniref:C-type lectin domain-containing protein n=1 Tax=Onychostoma macrolepis TaxID=369639 RepID=A0A7J6D5H5_9TELE|nr:hypothetical protein G5714_004548 [Onychostoma macrolepis]
MARDIECTTPPQTPSRGQNAGKAKKCRGSRCLVLMAVCSGLICVLLLVFIVLQHFSITAERDLLKNYKDAVQVFNQTISRLQDTYSDLMTENDQLKYRFNYLNDELKNAYEQGFHWGSGWFFKSNDSKTWFQSRQYCRDRGADLVIINTEVKQSFLTSIISSSERLWIGLTDINQEGKMKWVDNSPLKQGFWSQGQPDDYIKNEDCVELVSSTPSLNNWNDISCSDTRKALCEK